MAVVHASGGRHPLPQILTLRPPHPPCSYPAVRTRNGEVYRDHVKKNFVEQGEWPQPAAPAPCHARASRPPHLQLAWSPLGACHGARTRVFAAEGLGLGPGAGPWGEPTTRQLSPPLTAAAPCPPLLPPAAFQIVLRRPAS